MGNILGGTTVGHGTGSKIWDLFPAMSFLKILNFKTNLPNMNFDYTKLDEKIIFYAEL